MTTAVPDQMPFDIPYGPSIGIERAQAAIAAAIAEAKESPRNWKLAVAVVDTGGNLVAFAKMDGTQTASIEVAQGKARTAARFRRPTEFFYDAMRKPDGGYYATLDRDLVASPGGIPIVEDGKIIGGMGCSGALGSQDAVACQAGIDTIR